MKSICLCRSISFQLLNHYILGTPPSFPIVVPFPSYLASTPLTLPLPPMQVFQKHLERKLLFPLEKKHSLFFQNLRGNILTTNIFLNRQNFTWEGRGRAGFFRLLHGKCTSDGRQRLQKGLMLEKYS